MRTRTKDLMVGDYILVDNEVCQVNAIYSNDTISYEGNDVSGTTDDPHHIPITADFLEKNGFKKQDFDIWIISENSGRRLICYRTDYFDGLLEIRYVEEPFCNLSLKVKYVHELQHALRLCGIDKTIEL